MSDAPPRSLPPPSVRICSFCRKEVTHEATLENPAPLGAFIEMRLRFGDSAAPRTWSFCEDACFNAWWKGISLLRESVP